MKQLLSTLALAALASLSVLSGAANAAGTSSKTPVVKAAISQLEKRRLIAAFDEKTGMKATSVDVAPVAGFYELAVGTNVFYMDKSGKWLFDGHLVDLDTRTSLTAQRKLALERAVLPQLDWRSLNLNDAIKTVHGSAVAGRVLVTFEDPNCGYCKRLNPELDKLQNLTVYTFPISLLGPDSQAKNESLWCAKDRSAAWAAAMRSQPVKSDAPCDTSAIARNGELARRLMVQGTPTMFLADGSRIPGYTDAATIEARLAGQQK